MRQCATSADSRVTSSQSAQPPRHVTRAAWLATSVRNARRRVPLRVLEAIRATPVVNRGTSHGNARLARRAVPAGLLLPLLPVR